jgi:hypothetical protein
MSYKKYIIASLSALLTLLIFGTPAVANQASGKIGFSLNVQADGFFNPKVIKITVNKVEAGSLAQSAGLLLGDELLKVEDVEVPGAAASSLKPHMEFVQGKPKKLMFRRANGQIYEATLVKP